MTATDDLVRNVVAQVLAQMKGRGSRTISPDELRGVTGDAKAKDRFVIVDAVGIDPDELNETKPLERKKSVDLKVLMEKIAFGNRETDWRLGKRVA